MTGLLYGLAIFGGTILVIGTVMVAVLLTPRKTNEGDLSK